MTKRPASRTNPSGAVRGRPLLAPRVVSNSRGAVAKRPLSLPALARYSAITCWLKAATSGGSAWAELETGSVEDTSVGFSSAVEFFTTYVAYLRYCTERC